LADGWGRLQCRPNAYLSLLVKGGAEDRDPDRYDTAVAAVEGQNPLLRTYYPAYRYRSYGALMATGTAGKLPLALAARAYYSADDYTRWELGLVSGRDRRYALDLTWTVNERVAAYLSAGQELIDSDTRGSSTFSTADWRGEVEDEFTT